VTVPAGATLGPVALVQGELAKVPAFMRRDLLVAWSYRLSFFTDAIGLVIGAFMFYFVGLMVDPSVLPSFGGTRASYMEFVVVGIALGTFIALGLGRVAGALQGEQLMGTLESLLMTPTATATIQLGSVVYDLVYIPIRTGLFLLVIAIGFGLDFEASGVLPAALLLLLFIPFVWGLGAASAAATLTFRRGGGVIGFGVTVLVLGSGAFFPLTLLPDWVTTLAEVNPMALAIDGMRQALIGGAGFADVARDALMLAVMAGASLAVGMFLFRRAQQRERRRGTLGLY
jgi:ABC-2 type transport system permease protein